MDTIVSKLDCRFEQLRQHHSRFGFLYLFSDVTTDDAWKSAKDLEVELSRGDSRYIDGFMLSEEIQMLKRILPESVLNDPLKILLLLSSRNRAADFPNFFTALRILLTVPVTVASGEHCNGEHCKTDCAIYRLCQLRTKLQNRLTTIPKL